MSGPDTKRCRQPWVAQVCRVEDIQQRPWLILGIVNVSGRDTGCMFLW